jgi:hypothetical protein
MILHPDGRVEGTPEEIAQYAKECGWIVSPFPTPAPRCPLDQQFGQPWPRQPLLPWTM